MNRGPLRRELSDEKRHDGCRAECDVFGCAEEAVNEASHERRVKSVLPAEENSSIIMTHCRWLMNGDGQVCIYPTDGGQAKGACTGRA